MADTAPARYGTITFVNSFVARPAQFLAFADTTTVKCLERFIHLKWGLKAPEVLISVIGSAQDFSLSEQLQSVFSDSSA